MAGFLSSKSQNHLRQEVAEGAAILSNFFAEAVIRASNVFSSLAAYRFFMATRIAVDCNLVPEVADLTAVADKWQVHRII